MTKKTLATIMINCWSYTLKNQFENQINFLIICMYHTDNEQKANDIQNVIWYLMDKMEQFT